MTTFHPYHFTQTSIANDDDRAFITDQIKQFNNVISPHHLYVRTHAPEPLDLILRNDDGEIVGGLIANTCWQWLMVEDFWLHADLRRRGYGSQLLTRAEEEARTRGCLRSQLTTFSFQARDFYEKFGYRVVGEMVDFPPGETYYWLRKELV